MSRLLALAALLFALPAQAVVNIDWVTVGDPGNACETQSQGCFGAVPYTYRISKYEVTNAQYTEFLNAVAATDPNELYVIYMDPEYDDGSIARSGSSGSYTYSAVAGREDMPVILVSFYDALRFANWLHNGQPTGAQDSTTTEDGAYTITQTGIDNNSITRNPGARDFLTSEDEWYKAAYYKGGGTSAGYWDYPAGSDTQPTCAVPGATANTSNCDGVVGDVTDVGSYTGSASPSGTFDQGGNLWEWNEAIINGHDRGNRGGNYGVVTRQRAAYRTYFYPLDDVLFVGFRVASLVPPPLFPQGIPALSPLGLLLVAAGVLGFGAYRRGRA